MRLYGILAFALVLSACNSAHKQPLPSSANDPALVEIGKNLDDEDKKLLVGYLMRREMAKAFGGGVLPDGAKTVGEAIAAQRKWAESLTESERKAAELKADIEQKRKIVADQIAKIVTIAFLSAEFTPSSPMSGRYEDFESLSFAVHNMGSKKIKALKGQAVWIDTFGEEFVRVPMQFEESVLPEEKKTIQLGMEINQFMDEHKKIMQLDGSKRFRFEPEQIVFDDGSALKAPDEH